MTHPENTRPESGRELRVQSPCPKSWNELVGDERKRFCSQCELHVHNSAALTRDEAEDLVEHSAGRVCMRIVRDDEGAPIYRSDSGSEITAPRLPRLTRWLLAAGAGVLAACRGDAQDPAPDPGPEDPVDGHVESTMMGLVCPEELGDVAFPEHDLDPDATPQAQVDPEAVELLGEVCIEPVGTEQELMGRTTLERPESITPGGSEQGPIESQD